ncbi:MAG: hypothetical protein GKR95_04505 [Gammaproteobacteria bacterium]|nr:hypothetical protein [Gammaproteobacteria bacterium]
MVQAKRRKPAKRAKEHVDGRSVFHGLGLLSMGVVIGVLSTILWQGMNSVDDGVGAGIRQMIETSRTEDQQETESAREEIQQPEPQETNYDFYTVLPEMEVVVSADEVVDLNGGSDIAELAEDSTVSRNENTESNLPESSSETPLPQPVNTEENMYMLQAGSYRVNTDAERLRANLAIKGLVSTIQKVSIQGKGDFFRVRLGPYSSYESMVAVDEALIRQGIKSLRLKISQNG